MAVVRNGGGSMLRSRRMRCSHICSQLVTTASELKKRNLRAKCGIRHRRGCPLFHSLPPSTRMTTPKIAAKPLAIQDLGCSQWMTTRLTTSRSPSASSIAVLAGMSCDQHHTTIHPKQPCRGQGGRVAVVPAGHERVPVAQDEFLAAQLKVSVAMLRRWRVRLEGLGYVRTEPVPSRHRRFWILNVNPKTEQPELQPMTTWTN
jgi:hypothetical protein